MRIDTIPFLIRITFLLLFFILFIYILIVARNFLYPVAFAVLFSYLLYPVTSRFERIGIPRIAANLIGIFLAIFVVVSFFIILGNQLNVFVDELPAIQSRALKNLEGLERSIESTFGIPIEQQDRYFKEALKNFIQSSGGFIQDALGATAGTIVKFALMPVYIFFMLFYRNKFKIFILSIVPNDEHDKAEKIIKDISQVTKRYMIGVVIVIVILCFTNSIGLLIIGMEYAILFGILSALMNFIPYFGTLIGGAIPLIYALLTGSLQQAFAVVILFLIIQFSENNILTPNITGGQVNINPFATILTIIIGGMVWGLPGMFVSVPFLGMFKVICEYYDGLNPVGYLLGTKGTEEHGIDRADIKNFFARIFKKK